MPACLCPLKRSFVFLCCPCEQEIYLIIKKMFEIEMFDLKNYSVQVIIDNNIKEHICVLSELQSE